jgi:16S rRNA (guanine527-N7)-methyltransferase
MSENAPEIFGPDEFAVASNVSRETLDRLKTYVALLAEWNEKHNLVSSKSLEDVWRRHVWDSAQLARYIPDDAHTLVDLGSGAGFPGLVLAEMLRGKVAVSLYESTGKKAEFLKAAAARLDLPVQVHNERIEAKLRPAADIVTARALAPLDKLLPYAQQFASRQTICLFLKGQSVVSELTAIRKSWRMKALQHPSLSDPSGVVLEIRELRHAGRQ